MPSAARAALPLSCPTPKVRPLRLWRNPVFSVASALEFLVGFSMFGAIIFLPLYLQTVGGASAQNSGLQILPLMGGLIGSALGITLGAREGIPGLLAGIGICLGTLLTWRGFGFTLQDFRDFWR